MSECQDYSICTLRFDVFDTAARYVSLTFVWLNVGGLDDRTGLLAVQAV